MDGDVPEPAGRHPLVGKADPADALPAFEHRIVTNAVIAASAYSCGLFSCRPGNAQRRTSRICWLKRHWLRAEALKIPPAAD
jgi:hypothetical protein